MFKSLFVCLSVSYVSGTKVEAEPLCKPELNTTREYGSFISSCDRHLPLDYPKRKDPVPTRYHSIELDECAPEVSYMDSFRAQNRFFSSELILTSLPDQLPTRAFACLPASLMRLALTAARSLTLPLGALAKVRVRALELTRVRVDQVPPGLQRLVITHSGATLPQDALDVIDLTIVESNFTLLKGTAPRLEKLRITAPMVELPEAPVLSTLELYQLGPRLPPALLRSAKELKTFIAKRNGFTTLTETFFSYTPNLEKINLSNNRLKFLPSWLFSGLKNLTELNLKDNCLSAQALRPVGRVTSLRVLELDTNPIGHFCPTDNSPLAQLTQLTKLTLWKTKLEYICPDWLLRMRQLLFLDLRHNLIRSFSCNDMRGRRDLKGYSPVPEIRLENNPINKVYCSWMDHEETFVSSPPLQKIRVTSDARLPCSCGTYWLSRVVRERSAAVDLTATFEACPPDLGRQCRVLAQCNDMSACRHIKFTDDNHTFYVNDEILTLNYDDGLSYTAHCSSKVRLGDIAWPVFPRKEIFTNVSFHGCPPPDRSDTSYAEALDQLRLHVGENLHLYDLPAKSKFSSFSMKKLPPLKLLHLEAANNLLELPSGILDLVTPITSLQLVRVRAHEVPANLLHLSLIDTGLKTLQPEALLAEELTIIQKDLTILSGHSWILKKLSVKAPVFSLLEAPALQVLELTGAEPAEWFASRYPVLHTLRLRRLLHKQLPDNFLSGATQLRHFELTRSNFTTLPQDLFSFSPNLETIDLSNNQLEVLPINLFVGLEKVTTLNLGNNRLSLQNLPDLEPLISLKEFKTEGLNITEAPVKDLYVYEKDFPFRATCPRPALLDPGRTNQTRPARYYTVSIQDCAPPDGVSYATALAALGIHVFSDFSLNVSDSAVLSITSFHDLSPLLDRIWIAGSGLILQPGALVSLNTVSFLQLSRVQADRLPPSLKGLELKNTSYDELPPRALQVIELTIKDDTLKTISGSAAHLQNLTLDTSALESVSLEDVADQVVRGAWRRSPALRRLRLRRLRGEPPNDLLRTADHLTSFALLDANLTTLPEDFFSFTPNLTDIEISDNRKLQVLPEKLFEGLPNLTKLMLMNNQLSASVLVSLAKVTTLTELQLSRNPLGDLCTEGGSGIQKLPPLQNLGLARTGATRICAAWLRDARSLRVLDLSHNGISSVAFADLNVQGDPHPYINLTGNSIASVNCTKKDYQKVTEGQAIAKVLYGWTDPHLSCHCGLYWLWRLARESNDTVIFTQADKRARCIPVWRRCHPEDDVKYGIIFEEGEFYRTTCQASELDDFERPSLDKPTTFKSVKLIACVPPAGQSYLTALLALNIIFTTELNLVDVPAHSGFHTEWIADLPQSLREFKLRAAASSNPNKLVKFNSLNLTILPLDLLPPNLNRVQLMGTGLRMLQGEVFKTVESLHIEEDYLWSFSGTLQEVTKLRLSAPLEAIPKAPKLQSLTMNDAKPRQLWKLTVLTEIELHNLRIQVLPDAFLLNSHRLVHFTASHNYFSWLPPNLFAYSPAYLETIDLSNNRLRSLPERLFKGLENLKTLNLQGNYLSSQDLEVLTRDKLKTLKELDLSGNHLTGDLCPKGYSPLWVLTGLNRLNLSLANVETICNDWTTGMRQLTSLDLSGNHIYFLQCYNLFMRRDVPAVMRLENNTFDFIYCSWRDHEEAVLSTPPKQKVQVTTNTWLSCSCNTYWLSRVMRERSVTFNLSVTFESPCKYEMGRRCRMRTECPSAHQGCTNLGNTDDLDIYDIYGKRFIMSYDESQFFSMTCSPEVTLDNPALPVFPRRIHFTTVKLHGCAPQHRRYSHISEALSSLNITIGDNLYLYDLPSHSTFTTGTLESLPSLKLLHLEAAKDLVLPKGVLEHVSPITSLTLVRVHSKEVPRYLTHLNLTETGFKELQPGALQAQELTIIEKNRTSLSGYLAKLKKLSVTAPVRSLLEAPSLEELELTGAEPAAGFLHGYPMLRTLRLRRLPYQQLSDKFLRGATQLRYLELTGNNVTSLPADLFSFSLKLETIDLSNNKLQVLKRDMFVDLLDLKTLNVENNQLGFVNAREFTSLNSLKEFKYKGNSPA